MNKMSDDPSGSIRPISPWTKTPKKKGPPRPWLVLLARIDTEITVLARYRATWRAVNDLAGTSAAINEQPYFVTWISELYVATLALGVRKMVDDDPRAASLFNLLEKIAASPEKLTREWYCSDVYDGLVDNMDRGFTRDADPNEQGYLDVALVRADQQKLVRAASGIQHYVNQYVAHAQAKPNAPIPTFGHLHASVDVLNELFVKYTRLLTKGDRIEIEPVFQFPWQRIFHRAWSEQK